MSRTDTATAAARTAEQAVTLARDTAGQLGEVAAILTATAEWAEVEVAGGAPPRWVVQQMIRAERLIARAARGQAVTL